MRRRLLALLPLALLSLGQSAPPKPAFRWSSTGPVLAPKPDATHASDAVKDPSIVYANGKYHVFMTTAGTGGWHIAYTAFRDWSQAATAPITYLDRSPIGPGYRAAPQVFWFAPQKLWYLVYQGGDPLYSTTADIDDPMSWTAPKPFFVKMPALMQARSGPGQWLDFWVICDAKDCYLFNTDDAGHFYRSQTRLADFPRGFGNSALVMQDEVGKLFEASMTYKVAGTNSYVTMVEAIGPRGRWFRSWRANRLDGAWTPLGDTLANPFASSDTVAFAGKPWTQDISHGELVRQGHDQTLTIDPCKPLRFLYQGRDPSSEGTDYIKLPYRLGLATATGRNPIATMCRTRR